MHRDFTPIPVLLDSLDPNTTYEYFFSFKESSAINPSTVENLDRSVTHVYKFRTMQT